LSDAPIRFCPQCATAVERQTLFGEERSVCPSCGWIYFADPKVAVAVLVEKNGKILLTRRINEPHQGRWTLPAGFVNAHEDPEAAAIRECREETGLTVAITALVDVIGGREHPRGADILIAYRAKIIGGKLQPGDDADEADFFSYDALPELAFKTTHRLLDVSLGNETPG